MLRVRYCQIRNFTVVEGVEEAGGVAFGSDFVGGCKRTTNACKLLFVRQVAHCTDVLCIGLIHKARDKVAICVAKIYG
jgi:hypothetical protein